MKKHVLGRFFAALTLIGTFGCAAAPEDAPASGTSLDRKYIEMDRSLEGLHRYKASSLDLQRELKDMGAAYAHATITLAQPASVDDTLPMIERFNIDARLILAYARVDDQILTIGYKPTSLRLSPLNASALKEAFATVTEHQGAAFIGVVALVGSVDVASLKDLQDDPRVFLVDVSADERLFNNPGNIDYMQSFAWDLYHMSL